MAQFTTITSVFVSTPIIYTYKDNISSCFHDASDNSPAATAPPLTGEALWPGTTNMINNFLSHLPNHTDSYKPTSFLELGAGVGIASIFLKLSALRTTSIVCTDGEPSLVTLIEQNSLLNPPLHNSNTLTPSQLWFGENPPISANNNSPIYDVVFACDVLYDGHKPEFIDLLFKTVSFSLFGKLLQTLTDSVADPITFVEVWDLPTFSLANENDPGSIFLLAFGRRGVRIEDIFKSAIVHNLACLGVVEDSVYDVFDNNTDGVTDIWKDLILAFGKA
ncbi:hypothetical protein ScalyP_jg3376 [Parmales sp. scaly parma]|nr:hypothetical protein ScalyP_jg3376 [Parmales sp. scaly parma]